MLPRRIVNLPTIFYPLEDHVRRLVTDARCSAALVMCDATVIDPKGFDVYGFAWLAQQLKRIGTTLECHRFLKRMLIGMPRLM